MHKLLLRNLDMLPDSELDEVFAAIFNLATLPYSSGAHTNTIFDLILNHAIKLEIDPTVAKNGVLRVTLTPRTSRKRFEELRVLYYQGLQVDFGSATDSQFMNITVMKHGSELAPTLMRALITFAYKDVFKDRW